MTTRLILELKLKNKSIKVYGWSDSSVVLAWLNAHPSKWKPFVVHRVAEIQNSVVPITWKYVPTKCNPADVASRSILADEFKNHLLWSKGPLWLEQSFENWPSCQTTIEEEKINLEVKSNAILNLVVSVEEFDLFKKSSNLKTLVKVTAYCLTFINKTLKSKSSKSFKIKNI